MKKQKKKVSKKQNKVSVSKKPKLSKKLIFIGVVGVLVLVAVCFYQSVTGMAVKYECVDNDFTSTQPFNTRGIVTVSSNDGEKSIYTDSCMNENLLVEFSCSPITGKQVRVEHPCECEYGRCK